jgi:hypothetical protein
MNTIIPINNLPQNPERFTYFVCHLVDGQAWFFGGWRADQREQAATQAAQIGGVVIIQEN